MSAWKTEEKSVTITQKGVRGINKKLDPKVIEHEIISPTI
jgi:hypothetical protein